MKKALVIVMLFVLALSSQAMALNATGGITLRGGGTMINPSAFNEDYTAGYFSVYPALGLLAAIAGQDITADPLEGFFPEVNFEAKYFVIPGLALLLRGDFITAETSTTLSINGEEAFDNHVAFEFIYAGLGVKYYYEIPGTNGLNVYAGADGGMFMHMNSFWEIWADSENPDVLSSGYVLTDTLYQSADFTDMFFGGNVEAGVEYVINGSIGINLGAGYRIASSPIAVDFVGQDLLSPTTTTAVVMTSDSADLGGLYAMAGISFYFGGSGAAAASGSSSGGGTAVQTGEKSKYEKYGDYYFKRKNYNYAVRYYMGALKLSPNADLYKKIGYCFLYLKQKQKAVFYLDKYLEMNPNDQQIKRYLGR